MLNPHNIKNYNHLPENKRVDLEKQMQEDELHYLASVAFEQYKVTNSELNELQTKINAAATGGGFGFNTIFISVLCGLLIGISVFFVIFNKNQTHASVYQNLNESKAHGSLNNNVLKNDTIFPVIKPKVIEHFNTIAEKEEIPTPEFVPEILPTKPITIEKKEAPEEELAYQFTANAPVVFIDNLKITNYRLYYFRESSPINLEPNTGLPAQYENRSQIEKTTMNNSNTYIAHKVISRAMRFFNSGNLVNCLEELTILYSYNKNDANAQFYIGMCYYQMGKYVLAQNYFTQNLDNVNNIFHQESEFYMALCLLHTNQADVAKKQLQIIINNKGFYNKRAKDVLSKNANL